MILVYVTTKDKAEAREIGRALVRARLAGCVNIIDGMESIYHWQGKSDKKGKVETSQEAILLIKTAKKLFPAVSALVRDRHSYQTPCIMSVPIKSIDPAYKVWLKKNLKPVKTEKKK